MNEREAQALGALQASRKYGDICEATLARVFEEELSKRKNLKQAEKAARAKLHQISGAFMKSEQLDLARACMVAFAAGDASALNRALRLHTSTAERLPVMEDLYARVFERVGRPGRILDLACGLNPLFLGAKGIAVRGHDIQGAMTRLIDEWAQCCGWDVQARASDLTMQPPLLPADLALLMKLLPLIEQQRRGAAMQLLASVPARFCLVSFPTRTLSGRGVGMEQSYTRWFEDHLPGRLRILERFVLGGELCYITEVCDG